MCMLCAPVKNMGILDAVWVFQPWVPLVNWCKLYCLFLIQSQAKAPRKNTRITRIPARAIFTQGWIKAISTKLGYSEIIGSNPRTIRSDPYPSSSDWQFSTILRDTLSVTRPQESPVQEKALPAVEKPRPLDFWIPHPWTPALVDPGPQDPSPPTPAPPTLRLLVSRTPASWGRSGPWENPRPQNPRTLEPPDLWEGPGLHPGPLREGLGRRKRRGTGRFSGPRVSPRLSPRPRRL